jgi:xylulokinase
MSATGALVGLTLAHRRPHLVRAALEAVAFMLRASLEGLRRGGVDFDIVTSLGKPAESRTWTEIKADVCQLPVRRLRDPEVALIGAAMLVFVASGQYAAPEDATRAMSRELDIIEPDPGRAAIYDEMFGRYREVYLSLAPYFHREHAAQPQSEAKRI